MGDRLLPPRLQERTIKALANETPCHSQDGLGQFSLTLMGDRDSSSCILAQLVSLISHFVGICLNEVCMHGYIYIYIYIISAQLEVNERQSGTGTYIWHKIKLANI